MKNVGFIGTGNMAGAIIRGIQSSGMEVSICGYDKMPEKVQQLGIDTCTSEAEVVRRSDYVFFAFKPQNFEETAAVLKDISFEGKVIVSIVTGIGTDHICHTLGQSCKVVLVMPNTPLLLGCGASALCRNAATSEEEFSFVCSIFSSCGVIAVIPEDKMKEIIAVNGSTPAFIYLFSKGFIEKAKQNGIDEDIAMRLFCQTLIGSARMMMESGQSIDELIRMVSSPGGTTLQGLAVYEKRGLTAITAEACDDCVRRAYELAQQ